MEILIQNCNCIDEAKIQLVEGRINIKYAMNGTGKSTIAKAIESSIKGESALATLKPFKHGDKIEKEYLPIVTGAESIKTVAIFNEEYIKQFTFKTDEVINNSFEIFIRNKEYDERMEAIEASVKEIKETFSNNDELDSVIRDLGELKGTFGKSASGYSKAGALHKGIGNGNKLENIPPALEPYKAYLRNASNVSWLQWQLKGKDYLDISDNCPYCVSPTEEKKKETILSVAKEYDSKIIEHLNKILQIIGNLNKYFSDETNEKLRKITTNNSTISTEEISYLTEIGGNVTILEEKLTALKYISFHSFKDVDKVIEKLTEYEIKIEYLAKLDSSHTRKIVDSINEKLKGLISKATDIQKAVGIQKSSIQKTIQAYKREINSFLQYSGYKYFVDIEDENNVYKMKLKHIDSTSAVQKGDQHLSFGERNAFSLVLFMYDSLRSNPDLIILDDPISSFDRNKKYAILETLFRREKSLKNKTVLMLTHDFEPVIDVIHTLSGKFQEPIASFLTSSSGKIVEIPITKQDIITFNEVCSMNIAAGCDDIVKAIYLRRRYEVNGDKGNGYQLISNLLHKRPIPLWMDTGIERAMTAEEINSAVREIEIAIKGFNYETLCTRVNDDAQMIKVYTSATNNYEKLQIYRIIYMDKPLHESDIISKFIKESFHIENDYLMQLNPAKYPTTPNYIIEECDKVISAAMIAKAA